jgi:hypothetical protein
MLVAVLLLLLVTAACDASGEVGQEDLSVAEEEDTAVPEPATATPETPSPTATSAEDAAATQTAATATAGAQLELTAAADVIAEDEWCVYEVASDDVTVQAIVERFAPDDDPDQHRESVFVADSGLLWSNVWSNAWEVPLPEGSRLALAFVSSSVACAQEDGTLQALVTPAPLAAVEQQPAVEQEPAAEPVEPEPAVQPQPTVAAGGAGLPPDAAQHVQTPPPHTPSGSCPRGGELTAWGECQIFVQATFPCGYSDCASTCATVGPDARNWGGFASLYCNQDRVDAGEIVTATCFCLYPASP